MKQRVAIVEQILHVNDAAAAQNQGLLDEHEILGINVLASPGAGKTSLILETIAQLSDRVRIGVIEGDTAAVTIDADRIAAVGIPAVQINTGGSCHLDAAMVASALQTVPLGDIDLLIVENVGNLICPASFSLGTHFNIVVASVPEGDDKPYKYPNIYRGIDALILNKIDLLPYIDFDLTYFRAGISALNPGVSFFPLSCKTLEGLPRWSEWLLSRTELARAGGIGDERR